MFLIMVGDTSLELVLRELALGAWSQRDSSMIKDVRDRKSGVRKAPRAVMNGWSERAGWVSCRASHNNHYLMTNRFASSMCELLLCIARGKCDVCLTLAHIDGPLTKR